MKTIIPCKNLLIIYTLAVFTVSVSSVSLAHDGPHEDEDMILSELGNLGTVSFKVSCDAEAQEGINIGVAIFHHMMYAQAEKHYQELIQSKPDCAMAYWGYAMTLFHPLWPDTISQDALERGQNAVNKARTFTQASEREKMYIKAAAAYYDNWQTTSDKDRVKAWGKVQEMIHKAYPDDIDAAAIYALSKLTTASPSDQSFNQQRRAGEILDRLYKLAPLHPGVIHYTIHAYDNGMLAHKAVQAARDYDQIAPDVPHSLHMPSHIFIRLGMWSDVVSWNIRSAKAALKYPTKGSTTLHYVHALDYMTYANLQISEDIKAAQTIKEIENHHNHQDTFPAAYALAAMPARFALERQDWQLAKDSPIRKPVYISWDNYPHAEAMTYYARGLGAIRSGDLEATKLELKKLDQLYQKTLKTDPSYWAVLLKAQYDTVAAWQTYAKGDVKAALAQLRIAADLEDSMEKNPVTPGAVMPSRELLGDMLVLNQDYENALAAYEKTLAMTPNRLNSILGAGLCHEKLGNDIAAKKYYSLLDELKVSELSERMNVVAARAYLSAD